MSEKFEAVESVAAKPSAPSRSNFADTTLDEFRSTLEKMTAKTDYSSLLSNPVIVFDGALDKGMVAKSSFSDKAGQPKDKAESAVSVNEKEQLDNSRTRLNDRLNERLAKNPEALERMNKDMAAFEKRAAEQQPPLSAQEVAKTYDQISKLIETTGEKPVSQADRAMLAEQILHQAAHPNEVRQGQHGTCTVTAVESRLYTRNPSDAARLVTDVATTGKFITADKRQINFPLSSIAPDAEGAHNPSPDGERSYASQLFQITAMNDLYDRRNRASTPKVQFVYEQVTPTGPNDTGERVYDYSKGKRELVKDSAGQLLETAAAPEELTDLSNDITGRKEKSFVIANAAFAEPNTVVVNSEKDLGQKLEQMKNAGRLPVLIGVDTQNEPFFTDSNAATDISSGERHVLSITDYDPATGKIKLDNQWTQADDHEVSLHDLYRSTRSAYDKGTIESYKQDVASNNAQGKPDGMTELELLRLQGNAKQLTNAQYEEGLIKSMRSMQDRWNKDGESYPGEQDKARAKFAQLLELMPKDRARTVNLLTKYRPVAAQK